MNKFDDDIREYDPSLWVTPKKPLPKTTTKPKPEPKPKRVPKPKPEPKPKRLTKKSEYVKSQYHLNKDKISEELRLKNKIHYQPNGKKWYEENKERLKDLRKKRNEHLNKDIKLQKYLYNKQYYNNNRDEINKKRRARNKKVIN